MDHTQYAQILLHRQPFHHHGCFCSSWCTVYAVPIFKIMTLVCTTNLKFHLAHRLWESELVCLNGQTTNTHTQTKLLTIIRYMYKLSD